jgi:hypothetical protein
MELDDLFDDEPAHESGEVSLWLAVTIDAILTLRDGGGYPERARDWIEDPGNIFFEAVAEKLDYTPEGLRDRIREALKSLGGIDDKLRDRP